MRHRKGNKKLGRTGAHRQALLSSLVCNFIQQRRTRTTVAKAKEARRLAEKMVTLAKRGTLAARRAAIATLRDKRRVAELFTAIAPAFRDRAGGYTRIVRLGRRRSDGAELALLEWVGLAPAARERKKKQPAEKAADKAPAAEG